jgi:hypothetical protein
MAILKNELSLAPSSLVLSQFEKRLGICNSALQLNSKNAVVFLERHPNFARDLIARFYPLTNDFIVKNQSLSLKRVLLVKNESIKWDVDLIDALNREEFCWRIFGQPFADYGAPSADWSFTFIKHFGDYLNWEFMSDNPYIGWNEAMLDYFSEKIDWKRFSRNNRIPISKAFLKKYFDKLDWIAISQSAPLTEEIVHEYENYIDWDQLSFNASFRWSLDFIRRNENRLNWDNLSSNQSLPWSFSFFSDYLDRFNFKHLSCIKHLPWSSNFIESYFDKWSWDEEFSLTTNSALPWSEQFVLKYWDRWNIQDLASGCNGMTSWTANLIEKVLSESNDYWSDLENNDCLPWSVDLIENFRSYWTDPPFNRGVYEKVFASHINQDILNKLYK